jgi:hypothetical protein
MLQTPLKQSKMLIYNGTLKHQNTLISFYLKSTKDKLFDHNNVTSIIVTTMPF